MDRYEIREPIGQGGMGTVYRAIDTKLGRTVALKTVIPHRLGGDLAEEIRQRFLREALAASKVDHRNVVQVMDFGFAGDGVPYLVMEYLRGRDLGTVLKQSAEPLAVDYVADIILGVCAALRACHQVGIIHRDLKPANIFLVDTDTGYEVKVLDFGVSKAVVADELTEDGQILGTPQYLSPEQVDGKTVPETDQYAVGILLYVCLTKRLPYEDHQSLSLLRAIELGKFLPPRAHRPDLPQGLEALILRATNASPAERFESVHALGQRLWEFASVRGRDQWKNFYFHTPPFARQLDHSTRGVPLVEELARGKPRATPTSQPASRAVPPTEVMPPAVLAETRIAKSTELMPKPGELMPKPGSTESLPPIVGQTDLLHPSERIDREPSVVIGSQASVSTKLERPEEEPEQDDEDAPSEPIGVPPPSRGWRPPWGLLFGLFMAAMGVFGFPRYLAYQAQEAANKARVRVPGPPPPANVSPPVAARPARLSNGSAGSPGPTAPGAGTPRAEKDARTGRTKRTPRNKPPPGLEYTSDGVPIMP